jgi:hypothetical protein
MTAEEHNKTLGSLHLVYGGIQTLTMLFVSFILFYVWDEALSTQPGDPAGPDFFVVIAVSMFLFSIIFTIPSFIAGYGLLKRKTWGKLWGIIAGVVAGASFPMGTALCVYSVWFLLCDSGRELYANSQAGGQPKKREALYGAPQPAGWAAQYARGEREQEYAPPRQPPNWRD